MGMAKFKVGDRVETNGKFVGAALVGAKAVVEGFEREWMRVKWDCDGKDNGQMHGCYYEDTFDHVTPDSPSPAIRTVTRREIVPGSIELPNGTSMYIDTQDGEVSVDLDELWLDADSLREAAHLFNQLAEVLEEHAVSGKPAATAVAKPEWIEWHGGQCPVDAGAFVEAETRRGTIFRDEARFLMWDHRGDVGDLTAYRVLPCAN